MPLTKPPQEFAWTLQWKTWLSKLYDWVTGTAWQIPTLVNSWVDFGSTYTPARYRKISGLVEIQGVIKSGTATTGTDLFTLPVGHRPGYDMIFIAVSNDAITSIAIRTTGVVELNQAANSTYLNLSGIFFKAEQ